MTAGCLTEMYPPQKSGKFSRDYQWSFIPNFTFFLHTMGFWRPWQVLQLVPLFLIFKKTNKQTKNKMVDPKQISLIFKSEKKKKRRKKRYSVCFNTSKKLYTFHDELTILNLCQMVGLLFFILGQFQHSPPPSDVQDTCPSFWEWPPPSPRNNWGPRCVPFSPSSMCG